MVTTRRSGNVNGIDVNELRGYIESVAADSTKADRNPVVVARWVGGTRAEVTSTLGGPPVYMGGDDDPSAMGMLLRALAACDVEVLANKAALLGIDLDELTVEARGYFNIKRYLGLEAEHGPGYQRVSYAVRIKSNSASPEQLVALRQACVEGSPVGDTLERPVPVSLEVEAS